MVVTEKDGTALQEGRNTYAFICGLGPEIRRRIFLALVGDDFKTGDGSQAFVLTADVVLQAKDVDSAAKIIPQMISERDRYFRCLIESQEDLDG